MDTDADEANRTSDLLITKHLFNFNFFINQLLTTLAAFHSQAHSRASNDVPLNLRHKYVTANISLSRLDRRERFNVLLQQICGGNQVDHQLIAGFKMTLILGDVASLMALRQHAPDFRLHVQRMLQTLENEIAIIGAIAMPAQRRQRVRCVVRKVEAAFDRQASRIF